MRTIIKYVVLDLIRNRIIMAYTVFLLAMSLGIFNMDANSTKGIMSLMNLVLIFIPLVSIIFSTIYVYNSSEFIELLVAQPLKRKSLWLSIYFGLSLSMLLTKRWRCANGISPCNNSAAPRMAANGLFNSWVRVCT